MAWATESVVEAGGKRLAFVEVGEGSAFPALLLVHGAGGNQKNWHLLLRHLSRHGLHAIALELPGHGKSPGPGCEAIQDYARIVETFLDAKDLSSPILVGHSMGGAITLTLGLGIPEKLGGLILVGTGARLRVREEILNGLLSDFESTVDRIVGFAYSDSSDPALVEEGKRQLLECPPEVLWGDLKACDGFDVMERVRRIHLPAFVICGKDDSLTPPKYSDFLAENIPYARLRLIENAGHMVMVEQSRLVGEAIRQFVRAL